MSKRQIIRLVRKRLGEHPCVGVTIELLEEGVRRDGNWWYVPVRPTKDFGRTYKYYETLTDVEDDVKRDLGPGTDVLLVPSG